MVDNKRKEAHAGVDLNVISVNNNIALLEYRYANNPLVGGNYSEYYLWSVGDVKSKALKLTSHENSSPITGSCVMYAQLENGAVCWRTNKGIFKVMQPNGKEITLDFNYGGLVEGRSEDYNFVGAGLAFSTDTKQYVMSYTVGPYYGKLNKDERAQKYYPLRIAVFSESGKYIKQFKVPDTYLHLASANQEPLPPVGNGTYPFPTHICQIFVL